MCPKKRNSMTLLLLFGIVPIFFLGITTTQAKEKVVFKDPIEKKKITKKKPIEEKAKADRIEDKDKKGKGTPAYTYDPANKADPFKAFIVVKEELEEKEEEKKPKTYLETLDISQLTVAAIVLSDKGNWALVRDSKGEGHPIKVGTPIGRRRGRVIRILDKEVVVREYRKDFRGREIVRDIAMRLPSID